MGRFEGRVVFVTGGARGQGRSHALAFAREGADIVFCDLAEQLKSVPYPMSTMEDVQTTINLVRSLGKRCIGIKADVRDRKQVQSVVDKAISEYGRIDILLANAGIMTFGQVAEMSEEMWNETIDTCLNGVFNAMSATVPHMIAQKYGRIVATSSGAGKVGCGNLAHYCAAKWGVIGLVKSLAKEVGRYGITVNAVSPTEVNTRMIMNDATYHLFRPELKEPGPSDIAPICQAMNALPVPWVEPEDVSNLILWLCSDEAHCTTGHVFPPDAGRNTLRIPF